MTQGSMFGLKLRVCAMGISHTKQYQDYLGSEKWLTFSTDAKVATGGRCQGCDRQTWNLHVHHLTYERLGNEKASDVWVVCPSCHLKFHPHHKRRVNKARKKSGKRKIRGLLGVPKDHKVKRRRSKKTAKRTTTWTEAGKQAIAADVQKKLGKPRPCANDFRKTLFP